MFHKGHVPPNVLDCDVPLIVEPPSDLYRKSTSIEAKSQAWILCHILARFNQVLKAYKEQYCYPTGYEQRNLVRLVQDKTDYCNQKEDKWCFPLAEIRGINPPGETPGAWRRIGPYRDTSGEITDRAEVEKLKIAYVITITQDDTSNPPKPWIDGAVVRLMLN